MRPPRKQKSQFSAKLMELRRTRGLTQQQLADALGVSRDIIGYYEAKAKNPTAKFIQKVSDFFNVPVDQLLNGKHGHRSRPGRTSKLERQLELVRKLPKDQQKAISTVLDLALQNVAESPESI